MEQPPQLIPAVATGPLIGAWLDRVEARRPLIVWTQLVRAARCWPWSLSASWAIRPRPTHRAAGRPQADLPAAQSSRALVPVIVPRRLWDPANALDSISYDTAFVIGGAGRRHRHRRQPPPRSRSGRVDVLAALAAWRVREPRPTDRQERCWLPPRTACAPSPGTERGPRWR
jgi:hypothetical protein